MEYDDVVKEFIDFVNLQVGVYMNSIAGFSGAKMQMERQVARVLKGQMGSDTIIFPAMSPICDPICAITPLAK